MADRFKTVVQILGISASAAALLIGLLLLVSGYWLQGVAVLVVSLVGLALAAWYGRTRPEPTPAPDREWMVVDHPLPPELSATEEQMLRFGQVGDPVVAHADLARHRGEPGWPEQHHLEPRRPGAHRR